MTDDDRWWVKVVGFILACLLIAAVWPWLLR